MDSDYRDIATRNHYRELIEERGVDREAVMELVHRNSRDNARTPIQWDDSENAGFTRGTPWIDVNPNYYYQLLIRLRRANPVIVYGRYDLILDDDEAIYAFTRTLEDDRLLVILNFTTGAPVLVLPEGLPAHNTALLIANYSVDAAEDIRQLTLRPFEARVYRLSSSSPSQD